MSCDRRAGTVCPEEVECEECEEWLCYLSGIAPPAQRSSPLVRCKETDLGGDPCRGYAVRDGLCASCHELQELCRQHDEWYDEHGGEA